MKNDIEKKAFFNTLFSGRSLRQASLLKERNLFRSPVTSLLIPIIAAFLSSFLFTSCEDVIEVKLSDKDLNLYGVEASITTADQPTVFLYKTLRVNQDDAYPGISGAVVTISDNATPANAITLTENPSKKGFYQVPQNTNYPGVTGREYTVTIQTDGVTLIAKDQLQKVVPIDSIHVEPSLRGDKRFLGVFVYAKEPAGLGNYYKWDIYINNKLLNDAEDIACASDEFVDGNYISHLEIFTDYYEYSKEAKDRKLKLNDVIQVKQNSISKFAYDFYSQMINQSSSGSLFSVPVANIKSNFTGSNGKPVLGLFVAQDVSVSNKVLIDQKLEDQLDKRP